MEVSRASLIAALEGLGWPHPAASGLAEGAHIVSYEKDAIVFHASEPADLLYVLLSGEVKLYYGSADGERLLVMIARSNEALGVFNAPAALHEAESPQPFSAQALSRCKVAIIARARVARALRELPPDDIVGLVDRMNEGWARLCRRSLDLLTMNVRDRLVYTIREIARAFGIPDARGKLIGLKLSHEDFGDLVGASRPMVSKHLKELAKAGIFSKQNGRYVLWREDLLQVGSEAQITAARSPANLLRLPLAPVAAQTLPPDEAPRQRASR
jgi:CRP-like cAMP-binding protein